MPQEFRKPGEQLALDGMSSRAPQDRLFFAIYPDTGTARKIQALAKTLQARHSLLGAPRPVHLLHVTLHHLGDHDGLPESLVAAAIDAARHVSMPAFTLRFDRVASFTGHARNAPCVLRNDDPAADASMSALHEALAMALMKAGLGRCVQKHFIPHVTLLYDAKVLAPERVPSIEWTVDRFALVHSLLGRSEHRTLFARQLA